MFTTVTAVLVFIFCVITVVLPFRFPHFLRGVADYVRRVCVGDARDAVFDAGRRERSLVRGLRVWGASSAVFLGVLLLSQENALQNSGETAGAAGAHAVLAMGGGGVVLFLVAALGSFLPAARTREVIGRSGIDGVWVINGTEPNYEFRDELVARIRRSSRVCLLDVTGYELLGKGPGESGALLYDALDQARDVPVLILLSRPDPQAVDPERRMTSVLQSLLAEMNISQSTFLRRMKMTVDAIRALNEGRDEAARIRVRQYGEKPTFRGLLLDDGCIIIPWHPREERSEIACLAVSRETGCASLYESFRRHFVRVWGVPLDASERELARREAHGRRLAGVSQDARARRLPERAVSGSFAVRPPRSGRPLSRA